MPNSLKSRLKKLAYQGLLSEKDLSRIYTDNDVIEELEKIKAELNIKFFAYSLTDNFENDTIICVIKVSDMEKIIDNHISELKGEKTNSKGVLEQIAEKQKTLLDTTKAWSDYIDKNGNIY